VVTYAGWSLDELDRRVDDLAHSIDRTWKLIMSTFITSVKREVIMNVTDALAVQSLWRRYDEIAVAKLVDTFIDAAAGVLDIVDYRREHGLPSVTPDVVQKFRYDARTALVGVSEGVQHDVHKQIQLGLLDGDSTAQIALRIINTTGMSTARAMTVARTETHAAYESGTFWQIMALDSSATKRWVSHHDDRVRETHVKADKQTARLAEPFKVGRSRLLVPGVPWPAGHVDVSDLVNCRCTVMYDFDTITTRPIDGDRRL